MMCKIIIFVGAIFITNLAYAGAGDLDDVQNLHTNLLSGYDKTVRPIYDTTVPIVVNLTFNLLSIKEFDEVNGKFSVAAYFSVLWMEPRMVWNPATYGWVFSAELPQNSVWTPQITVTNPYDKLASLGKDFLTVQYYYNGVAIWLPGDIISSTCSVDVTTFPFDKQTCTIMLICWGFSPSQIILQAPDKDIGLTFYTKHGTWELLASNATTEFTKDLALINVYINMKRRPAYFIINIVLPIIFMIILNIFVFILPVECGERLSYAITVLLALAVFLTLVGDNLPKTSEPMSLLSYFLLAALIMSAVICIFTIVGLNIYYKSPETSIPRWIARLVVKSTCCKRKEMTKVIPIQEISNKNGKPSAEDDVYNFDEEYISQVTWPDVSNLLDKIMIVFSFLAITVTSVVFFVLTAGKA